MVEGYFREVFKDNNGKSQTKIHYSEKNIGYWRGKEYKRHSVGEIEGFCGWHKLKELCNSNQTIRNKSLPAFMFSTGCRVSEVNQLRLSHFNLSDPDFVQCLHIPIVKQKKIGIKQRTFSFPKAEPLYHIIEEYLEYVKKISRGFDPLLFGLCRSQIWKIVVKQGRDNGLELWAHWYRSQRASQLGYEYLFTAAELSEWFKVIDPRWALRYCKLGDQGLRKIMRTRAPETYQM